MKSKVLKDKIHINTFNTKMFRPNISQNKMVVGI